nr:type I-E CRISPR-associated endoribonuclease Cas2e [uncultured Sphaerochaeta sp.]
MSRLAIELKSGVFLADLSARVRDVLWEKITIEWGLAAIMVYSANTEQSYGIKINGEPTKSVESFDGILLLSNPVKSKE